MSIPSRFEKAKLIFQEHKGVLRRKTALELGVHPSTLYALRDSGTLEEMNRGLFRLVEFTDLSQESWVIASQKAPQGVICLISALAFHEITDQIPGQVYLALPEDVTPPRIEYPPMRFFHFSKASYEAGIQKHLLEGIEVKIYSPEKTVVDCFKFRNKIGLDVAIDALKQCVQKYKRRPVHFMEFARICRVASVMQPYLETLS